MLTFETKDQKEVRRFRIAQFNGRPVTVRPEGSAVTGHVRSVQENKLGGAQCWTITIVPNAPKAKPTIGRPAPLARVFAEDFY
jgi:hypothetical protein